MRKGPDFLGFFVSLLLSAFLCVNCDQGDQDGLKGHCSTT
jgi:hypothetical protein